MTMYSVQIVDPKAIQLLEDMADSGLIKLQPKTPVAYQKPMTDSERKAAHERVMRGSPSLNVDEMLAWLEESKKDRKLPFRDEE